MWHQLARFEKSWPPFCQIWIIFTHFKLWITSTKHNFKWKFKLNNLAVKGLSYRIEILPTWSCVLLSRTTTSSVQKPLYPHDALKHHFTSLKTDLIFLQLGVLEWKFPWNFFTNTWQFSLIFHPHQIIFIHYKSKLRQQFAACSGWKWQWKFRLERANPLTGDPNYICFLIFY